MIKIKLLTKKTLKQAVNLINQVFPDEEEVSPEDELSASLDPEKYKEFLLKNQILELKYWVAIDDSKKVIGTTGLCCCEEDRDEAIWVGWFCIHPDLRKKGVGTKLLQFSIKEARKRGKKFLRLDTSTDPNELNARRLYEKHGFRLMGREPYHNSNLDKLYYELRL